MTWSEQYGNSHQPTDKNIQEFINNDLWSVLNTYLQETYNIMPKIVYSSCSMQKGWNVKYKKSGKSLCTLYPMQGYYIALVVIGNRELDEAELLLPLCGEYIQTLFRQTAAGYGGKWLMIDVRSVEILDDVKKLIALRANNK